MNIDPRNAAGTSADGHDAARQPHEVGQASSPVRLSADQAEFEDQLHGLHPVHHAPDPAVSSTALNQAVPRTDHYPAASFVSARAQLAATLTGATLEALKNEIDLAEQQSARWAPAGDDSVDRDHIFDNIAASAYLTLQRFQNQDSDCKPRTEASTCAISHVRNTARDHSSIGNPLERYPMDRARQAGWHMRGETASPFVSLVDDPIKLTVSRDHWARAIAHNANTLHTYAVPKSAVWTPDDVLSSVGLGMNVEDQDNIDADVDLMCSLGRTPTRETERLFLGGDLESYRIASEDNPYKRAAGD
ncbi:hypothetical protein [Bradyrhizobium sp. NBAIM01]|uniref:hypothetical protein n=1 Tax=Bradyrhizobium sp. NBAIM01 TaxID=2793818 RepID=UPI001CD5D708|nr:hypothetical protein [Bradyrhizobium sp. NBAIM01]MCA1516240.1 hypothetical protein [Bradyrhizobium sp. NBAIM01]